MRKKLMATVLSSVMVLAMSMTAFAGTWWDNPARGTYYLEDDYTFPAFGWEWIDSDGDGVGECYYFNSLGYLVKDGTPDGYTVNSDGQWTEDGVVQKKNMSEVGDQSGAKTYSDDYSGLYDFYYDIDVTDGVYHEQRHFAFSYDPATGALTLSEPDCGYIENYYYDHVEDDGRVAFKYEAYDDLDYIYYTAPGNVEVYLYKGYKTATRR